MLLVALCASAQDEGKSAPKDAPRYGVSYEPLLYPQKEPDETARSIVKAIESKRFDYLLAQLADPKYVDLKIAEYRDLLPKVAKDEARVVLAFDRLVRETAQHFQDDPLLLKELRAFAKAAKWESEGGKAVGTVESIPAHKVVLRNEGGRWFLENRQQ